jgi:DNA polymerase III alpha subunit
MNVNEYGQVAFGTEEIIQKIYSQEWQTVLGFMESIDEVAKWNEHCARFELQPVEIINKPEQDLIQYHQQRNFQWKMPKQYMDFDPIKFFGTELERRSLNTQEYVNYLVGEIEAWGKVMSPQSSLLLWKFLNYLMAVCKEKDIVTGVGRGSSVSSLTLYLLGVHAVDPVKYKLNYEEFLR